MSIFSDKELEPNQVKKLNDMLPEKFRKSIWKVSDFKGNDGLYDRISNSLSAMMQSAKKLEDKLNSKKEESSFISIKNIKIFNTEPYNAEPIGMVDIGIIEKFGAASTGDRFAGGAIGYVIEQAIDDSFAKSGHQLDSVNKVKFELLKKAKHYYPECNMLFRYEVDFREIGSSGNVFIYMRGTAAKGENEYIEDAIKRSKEEINSLEQELQLKKDQIQELQSVKGKIPQEKGQIKDLLD